jgi:hypothetical protein
MNIVTGFISNVNRRHDRDITKYIDFGMELMAVDIPMTIFIEKTVFKKHIMHRLRDVPGPETLFTYRICGGVMDGMQHNYSYQKCGHITFVFFEVEDLFLWSYRAMAYKFQLNTGNPSKDTLEYMMVQCQKTEWMAIAAQMSSRNYSSRNYSSRNYSSRNYSSRNYSSRNYLEKEYVWIDFGGFHMFHGKIDVFQTELYMLRSRIERRLKLKGESSRICFARCWDPNMVYYGDIFRDVNWLFAGSVFGGSVICLNHFAMKMREKCLQILREKNTLMWEINIWAMLYREAEELFLLYPSDHSEIILRGYI